VSIVSFMVRYSDVVTAEANRMRVARVSRGYDPHAFWHAKALAQSVGSLFVRSYERGERVYLAMVSRGWTGSMPPLGGPSASGAQWAAGMAVPALAVCVMTAAWLTL
jgi:cobalt/nickel transport system permease protein